MGNNYQTGVPTINAPIDNALAVVAQGIAIFPARDKKPLVKWKDEASTELLKVSQWWERWPDAQVGVPIPRDCVAIDIDDFEAVREANLEWLPTEGQQTPSGGFHFFYKTDGRPVKQVVKRGGIALDTRVGGLGYVIAYDPESFKPFNWAPAPEWVYETESKSGSPVPVLTGPMGTRDDIIEWLGTLAQKNPELTKSDFLALLQTALAEDRIVALDPQRPWTRKDFSALASEAAVWANEEPAWWAESGITRDTAQTTQRFYDALMSSLLKRSANATLPVTSPNGPVPVLDYLSAIPVDIPWVIKDFVFHQGVTLVTGLPKAGKSTLTTEMMRCLETGDPFLDEATTPVPTLLVTEESGVPVGYKVRGLQSLYIYDRRAAKGETFEDTLNKIVEWTEAHPGGVVFLDTFAVWAGVDDENDASKVTKAMNLINYVAMSCDCSIVLVHHARKGGGANGEGVRGSGAMVASVDILLEIKRTSTENETTKRHIDSMGRVIIARRTTIDFDPMTRSYSVLDLYDVADQKVQSKLLGIPTDGEGMTRSQLGDLWGLDNPRGRIAALMAEQRLRRAGDGTKEDPYHYWATVPTPNQPEFEDD